MASPEAGAPGDSLVPALRGALSDRYEVDHEIGRGGAATVYIARDLRHSRPVAIKVMSSDAVGIGGSERFLNEIRTAARLTHPHILGVHDSGESAGLLYYVMPYVEGESLRARLARGGAFPVADAVRLVRELASALAHAHAHGVVHRDLKPENVLLSGGHAVIADFGIAKAIAAATRGVPTAAGLTATGVAIGTPAYMAPEQAVGDRNIDQRADLYSLGVVAYEVLAGEHPFGARSAQAHVAAHLTEAPLPLHERRAEIPPSLGALVMRLLAKDPAARPQSAQAVIDALDVLDVAATSSAPGRRRPRWRRVAAMALAVVAIGGGYAAWKRQALSRADSGDGDAIRTVAVIPFENTSGNQDDEYFSSGMTDELAHALAQIPGLRVAGRSSSYSFKGKAVAAEEIGRALDVAAIIGGSVRRSGERLRVTTQLVSTRDGKVLWDSVYESRSRDVFAVQDEFTRAIAAALMGSLGRRPSAGPRVATRGTTSEAAYDLFLRGQFLYLSRGQQNVERAVDVLRQAIAKDPNFVRAHGELSLAYTVLRVYVPDPHDSLAALSRASAERAMALDSNTAEAQEAITAVREHELDFADAERHYRRAIEIEPTNGDAHLGLGFAQMRMGHTDEGEREIREAVRLDPLLKSARTALALVLLFQRRYGEAVAESQRLIAVDSTFPLSYPPLAISQVMMGHGDSAVRTLERSEPFTRTNPVRRKALLFAYAGAGRWADVERLRAEALRRAGGGAADSDALFADLLLGDKEPLVRWLTTRDGQRRWLADNWFGCNPMIDPLWGDARFTSAMKERGVVPCAAARPWPFPLHRPSPVASPSAASQSGRSSSQ